MIINLICHQNLERLVLDNDLFSCWWGGTESNRHSIYGRFTVCWAHLCSASPFIFGGADKNRTCYLLRARETLSQMSYSPKNNKTRQCILSIHYRVYFVKRLKTYWQSVGQGLSVEHSHGSQVQFSHSQFSLPHSDTRTSFQLKLRVM